jgi:predicted metal-dependent hydrolase
LGHTDVAYAFRRAKRRTIGMAVGPDGLEVSAPRWVSVGEVELALREKADWIARKLVEMDERQQQLGAARIDWRDGVVIPYLGNDLQVVLDSTQALKKGAAHLDGAVLRLGLPIHADAAQIRDAAQAWLMRQAKVLFTQRLDHFAPQLQVQWRKLSLSSAATRWGSAGADGGIRLNWRLIHHKLDIIDYVVAHELSHLRVMNHSPQFWETVESVVPDYAKRRRVLREQMLPPWG